MTKFMALALLSACFLFPVYSYGQTPTSTKSSNGLKASATGNPTIAASDQRGTEKSPLIIQGDVTTKAAEKSEAERKEEKEKMEIERSLAKYASWTAGITLLLVFVTGGLAWFTYQLWGTTNKLVEGAQTAETPYLIPRITSPPQIGAPRVVYTFANEGKTPAVITRFQDVLRFIPSQLPDDPDTLFGDKWEQKEKVYIPFGPGLYVEQGAEGFRCGLFADYGALNEQSREFHFIGRIEYEDLFGRKREQRFCWKLIQSQDRIDGTRAGGTRYNYDRPKK